MVVLGPLAHRMYVSLSVSATLVDASAYVDASSVERPPGADPATGDRRAYRKRARGVAAVTRLWLPPRHVARAAIIYGQMVCE